MNEKLEAFKNVWNTLIAIGWHPIPTIIAAAAMFVGRMRFEPDVLDVNSSEAKVQRGIIKFYILVAGLVIGFIAQVAVARPVQAYDWMMCVVMAFGHALIGYVVYSVLVEINPIKILSVLVRRLTGSQEPPK